MFHFLHPPFVCFPTCVPLVIQSLGSSACVFSSLFVGSSACLTCPAVICSTCVCLCCFTRCSHLPVTFSFFARRFRFCCLERLLLCLLLLGFFFLRSLCCLPFGFSIFSVWNIGFIKAHCRFHLPVPVSAFWDPRYFASVTAGCEMMLAFFVVNTPYV